MTNNEQSPEPRDEQFEAGFDALNHCDLPGIEDFWADIKWAMAAKHETNTEELDDLDRMSRERSPVRPEDFARLSPDVIQEALSGSKAFTELIYALGGLVRAKESFYKVFEDVRYREQKAGGLSFEDVDSPKDLL